MPARRTRSIVSTTAPYDSAESALRYSVLSFRFANACRKVSSSPVGATRFSFRKSDWSLVTVSTMRSSTAVGFDAALGRLTSIPRYIMGAVSMKISSRTSTTSTSGMMLISARFVPIRRAPCGSSNLNAIFGDASHLGGGAAQEVEEVHREAFHLDGPVLHAVDEVVVSDDGRDRGAEPSGRRDQRLGDARRDHGEARRALSADPVKRRHDAPHRAEEADERRGARGRREEGEIVLEAGDLEGGRASKRTAHRLEPVGAEPLVEIVEHLVEDLRDSRDLLVGREVQLGEWALPELPRRAVHDGRAARLTEHPEELERLSAYAPELPRLLHDERPAHDREDHEHEQDGLGDRTRVPDEGKDAGAQRVAGHRCSFSLRSIHLRHYNHIRGARPRPPAPAGRDRCGRTGRVGSGRPRRRRSLRRQGRGRPDQ